MLRVPLGFSRYAPIIRWLPLRWSSSKPRGGIIDHVGIPMRGLWVVALLASATASALTAKSGAPEDDRAIRALAADWERVWNAPRRASDGLAGYRRRRLRQRRRPALEGATADRRRERRATSDQPQAEALGSALCLDPEVVARSGPRPHPLGGRTSGKWPAACRETTSWL